MWVLPAFSSCDSPTNLLRFSSPLLVCTNLFLGDNLASRSWESEMGVFYWRDNYLHVNCSSLKISLRNYPLPTYSPTHWAEISLHLMSFKNRVFLLPCLICCCIGRVLSFFCRQSGLLENSGSWNISAGVVWNSACCELTYNFKRTGIPLSLCSGEENSTSSMLQAGSSVGTKGIAPFIWMELN